MQNPILIAEISANHCGDINRAIKLIKCAKDNGANLVKIQTFTPDSMTFKSNKDYFKIKTGLWKGYYLWDLYEEAHTPLEWHNKLFQYGTNKLLTNTLDMVHNLNKVHNRLNQMYLIFYMLA